ncbi:hypothetical protein E6H24_05710 [Candidatus Bathyarchaeota archaeon]|nr:MAG: hypothetical protein E6H24_05710 [Candidatus Bathyarchaeota archaeon]
MSLKSQRRLAADLLGGGLNRVWIDPEDIKPGKEAWVLKIRAIRRHLRWLRDKRQLAPGGYKTLLALAKGGVFRSRSHVDEYVKAHHLVRKR